MAAPGAARAVAAPLPMAVAALPIWPSAPVAVVPPRSEAPVAVFVSVKKPCTRPPAVSCTPGAVATSVPLRRSSLGR